MELRQAKEKWGTSNHEAGATSLLPIKNSSQDNGIVMDLFGGSGSTLIACEQIDRIAYTLELDPKYATVIVKRYME